MTIGIFEGMGRLSIIVTMLVVIGLFCYLWYLFVDSCAKEDKQNAQKTNYYHYEPKREEPKHEKPSQLIIPTQPPIKRKVYIPPPPPLPTLEYDINITGKRNITDNKILLYLLDTIGFETVEKMSPKTTIIVNAMKTSTITTKYGGKTKHTYLFSTVRTTRENLISLYHSDEAKAHERNKMTASLRQKIMIRDNYTCQMCGKVMRDTVGLQIDHIIPINKGGKSVEENLQVLCSICNGRKSDKILGG